jgi:malonyl-CoA decarboxylase
MMTQNNKTGFLDRALGNLRDAWRGIAGSTYDATAASTHPDLPEGHAERLREQMRACLETRGGEVSARARAAALGHAYLALDATGRERFLNILANDFGVDSDAVDRAVAKLGQADGIEDRHRAGQVLRKTLKAPRVKLLTQFNALPEGVKFLVDMRAELMELTRGNPRLGFVEADLKSLLGTWFDVDFLGLRRITWDTSSAKLLEKLIAYEAVHAIANWDDLKNRLAPDRRCFAYFHPRMPDEPLIFVEVALVDGMAGNIQELLDTEAPLLDPKDADTAIFYSISNAQKGLAGISFGSFLIKRVVDNLAAEFKGLKTFATLSPAPGFRSWLDGQLIAGEEGLLTAAEQKAIAAAGAKDGGLKAALVNPDWHHDDALTDALRGPLMRLCARYLIREQRENGRAVDPVTHFHLSNGARIGRLCWMGDRSPKGLQQSAGMMINYVYKLAEIEDNHEAYTSKGKIIANSAVRGLVKS